MKPWLPIAGALLAWCVACTQDFDQFRVGEGGGAGAAGTTGTAGATPDGSAGTTAGSGGSAGSTSDASPDVAAEAGPCPLGTKACPSGCASVTDPAFGCGAPTCDPCVGDHSVMACGLLGECTIAACEIGYTDCTPLAPGCETATGTDPANCGRCGEACSLANATPNCINGTCTIGACDIGYSNCDGQPGTGCERNTASDPTACGNCTTDCTAQPGEWDCAQGLCQPSNCAPGTRDCNAMASDGCETAVLADPQNCGFCGNRCVPANATAKCELGSCGIESCDPGFADCDGVAANGCERNLRTDPEHCGECGRPCGSAGVLTRRCTDAACDSTCTFGLGNCSMPAAPVADDGCETNLVTSPVHCGSCGRACSTAQADATVCIAGLCSPTCQAGFGNCTTPLAPQADDGCESNLTTSVGNCGACGRACSPVGASATACSGGVCAPTCSVGRGDCTSPPAPGFDDGCETNLDATPAHCGACGRACASTNVAIPACAGGLCTSLCSVGFGNCVAPAAPAPDNGCETNVETNPSHCGACARACATTNVQTRTCAAGICTSTCNAGFGNCTTPLSPAADDGCETAITTNPQHCGACGRGCSLSGVSGAPTCAAGLCTSACAIGANCSQPASPAPDDGCETDLATNALNCGACARACNATSVTSRACVAGTCASACDLGRANCTLPTAPTSDNGCEQNANTNTRCGGCANNCSAQGTSGGFVCGAAGANLCGCSNNNHCDVSGGSGDCIAGGLCRCHRFGSDVTCRPGEACIPDGGAGSRCSCNGASACSGTQTCCQAPAGCFDLATNAQNCGACGRACPPEFACLATRCECDQSTDCNGGTNGTCTAGRCVCAGITCDYGERCLPDGTCG